VDLHPASTEFASANTPEKAGLSAPGTYPQSFTNQAPSDMKLSHPTTAYLCSLALSSRVFSQAVKNLMLNTSKKIKEQEPVAKRCETQQSAVPLARLPQFWVALCVRLSRGE